MQILHHNECLKVHGGNPWVPILAAAGIGASVNLLAWTLETAYNKRFEEFDSPKMYYLKAFEGTCIAVFASAGFLFAHAG